MKTQYIGLTDHDIYQILHNYHVVITKGIVIYKLNKEPYKEV